jgi:hypothetical protein
MRRTIILVFVALLLASAACSKKNTAPADNNAAGPAAAKAAAATTGGPADKLKVRPAAPDIPADQTSPGNVLTAFFAALDIAENPDFQGAKEPDKAKKYQEARARLRQLFVSGESYTEITAYLDLIKMKRATVADPPKVTGDKATMKVHILKGDGLTVDPMAFGETSPTEADAVVDLVKQGADWKIEDFGGLAAKARAPRG